jgi:large subunit ribosomal protein L21
MDMPYFLDQGTVLDGSPPTPPTYPPEMCAGIKKRLHYGRISEAKSESFVYDRIRRKKGKDMFAVIKSGGRQYKVSVGQKLEVNRLPAEIGTQIALDVLLISDADQTSIGSPFIDSAQVLATVDGQTRGEKLIVFKYKSKKRYRHRRGHRQELTALIIDDIVADGKSLVTGEAPVEKQAPVEEETTVMPAAEETESTDTGTKSRRRRSSTAESTTEE